MTGIIFLTLDEVFELHLKQIELFGGSAGLRDRGLLESAIAQPSQTFGGAYLHEDLAAMAAAYLFHIVSNHPFVDGNKRTGTNAAIVFLDMNGFELETDDESLVQVVLAVAQGTMEKTAVAQFIRDCIRAI
jgi:death-on-curing protein